MSKIARPEAADARGTRMQQENLDFEFHTNASTSGTLFAFRGR